MSFFHELKRRNVFRVAAAYVISAWLIIQVAETLFPVFGFDNSVIRAVVIVLAIGLLPALIFSWIFELTPEGLKLDKDVDLSQSVTGHTGKKLDRVILAILVVALSYFAVDKFLLDPVRDAERFETGRKEGRMEALVTSFGNRSIAVLPFADMSPQGDQSYLSEGISEELLNLLGSIPEVRVTSRSSAFSVKGKNMSVPEIAERLNVSYVLDGSVQKAGDQVRISARLIEAGTDTQLWSKKFDRTLDNIFQIQDEIASDVVQQIKGTLEISVPQQRETNAQAYALYLQARHQRRLGTAEGYSESIRLYKEALAIDPTYPPAWNEMAASYQSQAVTGLRPAEEGFRLAREAALTAIKIDPDYARGYDTLGFMSQHYEPDLAVAAGYYKRALELAPGDAGIIGSVGMLLQSMGRLEQGLKPIEYGAASDPLSPGWQYTVGLAYQSTGKTRNAIDSFRKTLELSPDFSLAYYQLGISLMLNGQPQEALAELEKEKSEHWRLVALPIVLFALEQQSDVTEKTPTDSQKALDELISKQGKDWAYNIAYVYAHRGDVDAAFAWLDKAVIARDSGLGSILTEPLFQNLHSDPRWLTLLKTLGKDPDELAAIELEVTLPN